MQTDSVLSTVWQLAAFKDNSQIALVNGYKSINISKITYLEKQVLVAFLLKNARSCIK